LRNGSYIKIGKNMKISEILETHLQEPLDIIFQPGLYQRMFYFSLARSRKSLERKELSGREA